MNWYKKAQNNIIISFDFDDTIFKLEWDGINNDYKRDPQGASMGILNQDIARLIKNYASKGIKIIIVSSRQEEMKQEIVDFVTEHNLPISDIYCTNGQDKVHLLKELGVSKHFDDDRFEIDAINKDGQVLGITI